MNKNRQALIILIGYFALSSFYVLLRYVLLKGLDFSSEFVLLLNKAVALTIVFLLFQIVIEKHNSSKKPDKISHAKFFGTASTLLMFLHAILSVIVFDNKHLPDFFSDGFLNETGDMTLLWGISALSVFLAIAIIGVTAKQDNAKRRNVYLLMMLGYVFLLFHLITLGEMNWINISDYFKYAVPVSLISFLLAAVALIMNVIIKRRQTKKGKPEKVDKILKTL
jgi:hypothetical protein